jgi:hypothetical protein
MPRRPRAMTYAEAVSALHDAHLTLLTILQARLPAGIREQLQLLSDRLALLLRRDNGRTR